MEKERAVFRSHQELPAVLTTEDFANFIRMSEPKAREMIRSEGFPLIKNRFVGSKKLIPKGPLIAWLKENGWL